MDDRECKKFLEKCFIELPSSIIIFLIFSNCSMTFRIMSKYILPDSDTEKKSFSKFVRMKISEVLPTYLSVLSYLFSSVLYLYEPQNLSPSVALVLIELFRLWLLTLPSLAKSEYILVPIFRSSIFGFKKSFVRFSRTRNFPSSFCKVPPYRGVRDLSDGGIVR